MNADRYELVIGDCPDEHTADCVRFRVIAEQESMVLHLDPAAVRVLAARLEATLQHPSKEYPLYIPIPGTVPQPNTSPNDWFNPLKGTTHPVSMSEARDAS